MWKLYISFSFGIVNYIAQQKKYIMHYYSHERQIKEQLKTMQNAGN